MTQEEKSLLLQDLCARLPYGIKCRGTFCKKDNRRKGHFSIEEKDFILDGMVVSENNVFELDSDTIIDISSVKPYLRPMSSMTEEEKKIICSMNMLSDVELSDRLNYQKMYVQNYTIETFDLFNAHYLDYRGLIPMGLALEALEGMYKYKNIEYTNL